MNFLHTGKFRKRGTEHAFVSCLVKEKKWKKNCMKVLINVIFAYQILMVLLHGTIEFLTILFVFSLVLSNYFHFQLDFFCNKKLNKKKTFNEVHSRAENLHLHRLNLSIRKKNHTKNKNENGDS